MSLAAFSQTDTSKTKKDTTSKKDTTAAIQQATSNATLQETQATNAQQSQGSTGQQSASVTSNTPSQASNHESTPKANFGRYYIPALGSYQSSQSTGESKSVTITGDESNPGKIWIDGLASTRFYALLKAVPGTYKVPAQKIDDMNVQEGTVIYDENSKQINICLGCGYKDANPSEALATPDATATTEKAATTKKSKNAPKVKAKTVVNFTGTKSGDGTASLSQ